MANQSQRFLEGTARDVPVKIKDHYVLTYFLVIDMRDEQDPPIVLGRPFLNTTRAIIYIRMGEIHFQFRTGKVHVDGPYNKDSTVKTSGSRGVYNKFHAHF
jgi:hypothetical protein